MPVDVRHDAATQRFVAEIDGQRAECDYRLYEHDGEVMFSHTYVPPALRGQGVAAELVRVALDWARARGLKVMPACSYVRRYMRGHPETLDLMAEE